MRAEFIEQRLRNARLFIRQAWAFAVAAPAIRSVSCLVAPCLLGAKRWLTKHRRLTASVISVWLHVLLVLALLPQAHQGFSAGGMGGTGFGEGDGLSLDLTALRSIEIQALQVRQLEPAQLDEVPETKTLDPRTAKTEEMVVTDLAAASQVLASTTASQEASPQAATAEAAQGGEGQGGTSTGTIDDLWNAIAPCWRRLADKETLPVNLKVSFAGNGMLAKPPSIERRPGNESNMQSLRSESLAITALAECGVYEMVAGRENVSIHFPDP